MQQSPEGRGKPSSSESSHAGGGGLLCLEECAIDYVGLNSER